MTKKRLSFEKGEEYIVRDDSYDKDLFDDPAEEENKPDLTREGRALQMLLQDSLTPKQKCSILLYYRDGLTVKQIAQKLGVDKSTVSRTINRGRQRIASGLTRNAMRRLFDK